MVKEPKSSFQVSSRYSCFTTSDDKRTGRQSTRFDMLPLTSIQCAGEVNIEEQHIPKNLEVEGQLERESIAERVVVRISVPTIPKKLHNSPLSSQLSTWLGLGSQCRRYVFFCQFYKYMNTLIYKLFTFFLSWHWFSILRLQIKLWLEILDRLHYIRVDVYS